MIPLNRRTLFGLAAAAAAPLPAIAAPAAKEELRDMTAPGYAARIDYAPPHPDEVLLDPADHLFPG